MILFRKMLRDMRYAKAQYIAIFLMIFLGVFIFSGINADWNGMKVSSEQYYDESNLADVWVNGTSFSKDDVVTIKDKETITNVERRSVVPLQDISNEESTITLYVLENQDISKMYLQSGSAYSTNSDGIWLDESYAKENDYALNDEITLQYETMRITKQIQGLIIHPEYVFDATSGDITPNHKNDGFAFINASQFEYANMIPFNQLLIKSDTPQAVEQIVKEALADSSLNVIKREDVSSYAMFQDEITQHQAFATIFPIVFLLIAVLTTLTTLSKLILNQRTQIGILKALGFSKQRVIRHYISHIMFVAMCGALLGYIVGPLTLPMLIFTMMSTIYILPDLSPHAILLSLFLAIGSVVLCFIIAYGIAKRQLKENAASCLRPVQMRNKNPHKQTNGKLWTRFNFYTQWNLRDILRNKTRSLMAVVGVAGCMGLMFCALGLNDSMNQVITTMYEDLQKYEMRININQSANIEQLKTMMQGSAIEENVIEIRSKENKKTSIINVWENTNYTKMQSVDQYKEVDLPSDGLALSYKLANELSIKKGDMIEWHLLSEDTWVTMNVSQIIHTPAQQGITLSKELFEDSNHFFIPNAIVGNEVDVSNVQGITNTQYVQSLREGMETMMDGLYIMIFILIFGAVILGIVVLYNLQTFSFMEKEHEIATLKVLGFKNKQVKKLLHQQNFWLTIIGIILGVPFGYILMITVLETVGDSLDISLVISMLSISICVIGTLLLSEIVVIYVTHNIRKIDMVSALKANE